METVKRDAMRMLKVIILALVFVVGTNYLFAVDWSPPTSSPPGGNTAAPLNVTGVGQIKAGGLTVGTGSGVTTGLLVENGNFIVQNGNVGIGVSPTRKLHVFGGFRLQGEFYDILDLAGTNNQVLTKVSGGVQWKDAPAGGGGGGGGGGGISGSGTAGKVAKFSNATAITDSVITESGGRIGIGVTSPDASLDIFGNIKIRGGVPGAGKVLTADDSTGAATWQAPAAAAGVQIASSGSSSICSLTTGKDYMVTVFGATSNAHEDSDSYTLNVTVNQVSRSISIANHPDGTAPFSISLKANTGAGNCLSASVSESPIGTGSVPIISGMAAIGGQ